MARVMPHPFVKWAGGKARVSGRILPLLPDAIGTYYEPFLGGGAIFFELARAGRFKRAVLSDANPELVNCWRVLKKDVDGLVKELKDPKYVYDRDSYMEIRSLCISDLSEVERAARTIYLNKTGFNGLYRVNGDGDFNVPFGKYSDPTICDEQNLRAVSRALKKASVVRKDFKIAAAAGPGDAVYFDPPYIPVSGTSGFTSYTKGGFGLKEHERLTTLFKSLAQKGVRCVLSNSAAADAERLYAGHDQVRFMGTRSVGGPADFRKPAGEMIVSAGPRVFSLSELRTSE